MRTCKRSLFSGSFSKKEISLLSKNKNPHSKRFLSVKSAKVILFEENGEPEKVLSFKEVPLPATLGRNEVLIKWLAAPINHADLNIISGTYGTKSKLPAVGGTEGVGVIVETGTDVKTVKVDDSVIPAKPTGTWRTYGVVTEQEVLKIPSDIRKEYAATLSSPCTAYRLLQDFVNLKSGDVIIQNGANSMVGTALLQIANSRGIKSLNVIRQRPDFPDIVEKLKNLGGHSVYTDEYISTAPFKRILNDMPSKPKLALNMVGGTNATELIRHLGEGGTMVTYGGMSHRPVTAPTSSFIFNDVKLVGFWLTKWLETHSVADRQQMLDPIFELIRSGKLQLWMQTWKFDNFFDALKQEKIPQRDRKVVLTMQ